MRRRKFLILFCGSLILAALLAVLFAPFIVASGLRLWMARVARQQGLLIEAERIEAPFLRPAIIHNLRVSNGANAPFRIEGLASRLEIDLNVSGIFTGTGHSVHALSAEGVAVDIRRKSEPATPSQRFAWPVLANLLADNFRFSGVHLHVENGNTIVDLREGALSGSQLESGVFVAKEIAVHSPWFHRSFSNLHGATSWQEGRLVIGALSLLRGLDLDTMTVDLSAISESRIGVEMDLDLFGGKVRARISSDDRADKRIWDVAGNGSGVSLAQMSDALEWTNRASGSIHACKFTFRGEMTDLRNATASLWTEVSGLTWRDRTADTVMMGASLYNREVQIEQLYIKQRNNQLTLSGEFALPEKTTGWIKPAFRGDISASINDLGDFARLFGWSASDFSGELVVNGSISAREQKLGGQLTVSGHSLVLFRSPIESVDVKLGVEESRLSIAQFELRQKEDFFRAQGEFALAGDRIYSAAFQTSVAEVSDYAGFISRWTEPFALRGSISVNWTGTGAAMSNSGTFHAHGQNLRLAESSLLPFNAEFEANYSPGNIFFRQFHLWNQRADLSAFVSVAPDYLHLQEIRFSLNNQPRLQGNVFLPVSLWKLRHDSRWLAALSPEPMFDVDVTLDATDLAELAAAVSAPAKMSGQAAGRLQLFGPPASLEGKAELRLRDFVFENAPALRGDADLQLSGGVARFKANAIATSSDAVKLEASLPLRLEKGEAGFFFNTDGPLAATLDFPAIFLAKLPRYISREIFTRGILGGHLTFSDSLRQPNIMGEAILIDAQFLRGFSLSTRFDFQGRIASIKYADFKQNGGDVYSRGDIDFRDLASIELRVRPSTSLLESTSLAPGDCVCGIELSAGSLGDLSTRQMSELGFRGSLFSRTWTVSLSSPAGLDEARTFPFCFGESSTGGKTLTLGLARGAFQ